MNFRFKTIFKISGFLLIITGLAMIPSFIYAKVAAEYMSELAFGITGTSSVLIGAIMYKLIGSSSNSLRTRDGYFAVVLCWIICSLAGAVPYMISGQVSSFIDAFFEAVAGYTTTGATVTPGHFSNALLLWKATTHWLGGMGILVFIISILPTLGVGGQRIASAETPGPGFAKLAPRMQDLAKMLYFIYITLTVTEFLLLWIGSKMNAFEAAVNSLGSISTAGLFLHPEGIGYYNSVFVELVIAIFTILSSINFIVYINLINRNIEQVKSNVEIKTYLSIIAVSTVIISFSLWLSGTYNSFGESLRHGFFQTAAFSTTSGFTMDNYMNWPALCQTILFCLLFIGGCAASTAGSIKVIRIIVMFKLIARGFYRRIHPRSVRAIKVGDVAISAPMVSSITTFIILYLMTFLLASLVISLQGLSLETTVSTAASIMSTTGIAFGSIGASGDFSAYCPAIRLFLSLLMIVGRLEIFTVFLMFFPSFWNPDRASVR